MLLLKQILLPLEILVNVLVEKYLISSYCITVFSDRPLTFYIRINYISLTPNENLVDQIFNVSEMGCSDYILYMKDPEIFMSAFETVVHTGNIRRSDRKIIILPYDDNDDEDEDGLSLPSNLFSLKESSYVANMLVIVNHKDSSDCVSFDLFTHTFVGADDEISKPLYLDRWDACTKTFETNVNLFPHDITNMYGKTLKVACFTYKPYVLLDVDTSITPLGKDGIEIRIVDEFCRWLNCTIELIREDLDQWGEIYENGTSGNGVIGAVLADRADLGITALYSWYEEFVALDFSAAIVRSGVTCIAPAPRLLSSWDMPLMPFTWYLWLAVVVTFFYASLGLLVAEGCSRNTYPFLSVFGILVAQSQYEKSESLWKIRSVKGWLLVTGLIIGSAYGAGLASTFTVPQYEPSIDTVHDIVDRNMEWGATHDAWIFSLTLSNEPLVKKLVSQFRIYPFEELKRKSFLRTMAYSIEKLPAGNFAIGEYITKEAVLKMMIMLEDFYYEQCVVMLRKSSPYTEKMTQLVGRLHQSGLLLAWETQVALKHLNYKVQLEVRLSRLKNDDRDRAPLSLQNVEGIFVIYAIGVVTSIIVFFIEICVHYRKLNVEN